MRSVLETIENGFLPIPDASTRKAVVVLSGGQDSVTVLAAAVRWHGAPRVHAISFDYGQRHSVELSCARDAALHFNIKAHEIVSLRGPLALAASALTGAGDVNAEHPLLAGRPASFVPNRNAMMLTVAHAYAQQVHASYIYTGANATDYSGYPDCRPEFLRALQTALTLGSEAFINIQSPLLHLTKAQTFSLAFELGALDYVIAHTHTCYNGDRTTWHAHGYGCGHCAACELRAAGYAEFVQSVSAAGV